MPSEPILNPSFIRRSASRSYLLTMQTLLILCVLMGAPVIPGGQAVLAASDQDAARDAAGTGQIRPLPEILSTVGREVPGRVIDVQLNKRTKPWTYQIKVRTEKGNVVSVTVDAASGRIMSVKGRR